MFRLIIFSLLALVVVIIAVRSGGISPEQIEDRLLLAELNAEAGDAYRSHNGQRDTVVTLSSGLQLEVLRLGDGPIPQAEDIVTVHYRGRYIDGREFDNSYRRGEPPGIPVSSTIPGWREALQMMPVGTQVRLVVPYWLGYGAAGAGDTIGPSETLIFELELLAVVSPAELQQLLQGQ